MMLNCKQTAQLISDGLDRKLSLWQRMNLRFHLMMCGGCSAYRKQVEALNKLIRQRFADSNIDAISNHQTSNDAPVCSEQTRQRIIKSLREATA